MPATRFSAPRTRTRCDPTGRRVGLALKRLPRRLPADAARRSLVALFAATFAELAGLFMFGPLLLLTLKARGLDTAAIGAFAVHGVFPV